MNERPKMPRDLVRVTSRTSFRPIADYFTERAKRRRLRPERKRLAETAGHFRELADLEEEVARIPPKPPAPSI